MTLPGNQAILFGRLDRLVHENAPSLDLLSLLLKGAGAPSAVRSRSRKAERIMALAEAGAWTEAALALIELKLPGWTLRRLALSGDEWICSLSRQPNLSEALDDAIDAHHELMPVAILLAIAEALEIKQPAGSVPSVDSAVGERVVCENFA